MIAIVTMPLGSQTDTLTKVVVNQWHHTASRIFLQRALNSITRVILYRLFSFSIFQNYRDFRQKILKKTLSSFTTKAIYSFFLSAWEFFIWLNKNEPVHCKYPWKSAKSHKTIDNENRTRIENIETISIWNSERWVMFLAIDGVSGGAIDVLLI